MNKAILITDEHFGIANNNITIYQQQKQAFNELFSYMLENDLTQIFSLGDFFDSRTSIGVEILYNLQRDFFDKICDYGFNIIMLVGNHNMFNKNDLTINNIDIFQKMYPKNVKVISEQTIIEFNGKNINLCPWLLKGETIYTKDVDIIFAHCEINGFHMTKNYQYNSSKGIEEKNIKIPIISGHFHIHQKTKKVTYLGNSFIQDSWNSFNIPKGFHIFDSTSLTTEFIENKSSCKHLKCYIDVEKKEVAVEGYDKEILKQKINKSTDYSIFSNNKLKIYVDKELAVVKQFVENIDKCCLSWKLEIINKEDSVDIEEKISNAKDYDIEKTIVEVNDEEDHKVVLEIITEANELMRNQLGG